MGLWKYNTIVGGWHFEDGTDFKGSNDITLTGATTVAGKLNNAQSFVTNDYGVSDGLVTSLASVTKGTIAGWVYLDADSGLVEHIMTLTNLAAASGGASDHRLEVNVDWGSSRNRLNISTTIGGVAQSNYASPNGSLTAHIGAWLCYEIEHDGSAVTRIQFNGVDQTINTLVSTDETVWFSDIITAGADTFSWGSIIFGSVRKRYLNGDLDETMINSELWDATDRSEFYNAGAGQEISAPINLNTIEQRTLRGTRRGIGRGL